MCVIGCGCARDCCSPLLMSLTVLRRLQTEMFAAGWSDGTVRACLVLVHRVPLMIGVWQVSIYSVGSSAPWCSLPLRSGHAARYAHTLQLLSHVMRCTDMPCSRVRWLPLHTSALMVLDTSSRFSL
jgi:hypothetical protein